MESSFHDRIFTKLATRCKYAYTCIYIKVIFRQVYFSVKHPVYMYIYIYLYTQTDKMRYNIHIMTKNQMHINRKCKKLINSIESSSFKPHKML